MEGLGLRLWLIFQHLVFPWQFNGNHIYSCVEAQEPNTIFRSGLEPRPLRFCKLHTTQGELAQLVQNRSQDCHIWFRPGTDDGKKRTKFIQEIKKTETSWLEIFYYYFCLSEKKKNLLIWILPTFLVRSRNEVKSSPCRIFVWWKSNAPHL